MIAYELLSIMPAKWMPRHSNSPVLHLTKKAKEEFSSFAFFNISQSHGVLTLCFSLLQFTIQLFGSDFDPAAKSCKSNALHADGAESLRIALGVNDVIIIGSRACTS